MRRILLPALFLLLAAPAEAGTYRVRGCHAPDGQARSMLPFARFEVPDDSMNHDDLCRAAPGVAYFEWAPGVLFGAGQRGGYRLDAPAGTSIAELAWFGSITGVGAASGIHTELARGDDGAVLWDFTGDLPMAQRHFPLPPGTSTIVLRQACRAVLCATSGVPARTTIGWSLDATLTDASPPTASAVDGTLSGGRVLHGTAGVAFTAADAGAGLARAWLDVDGTARAHALDTSASCSPLPGDPRTFDTLQPCARTAGVELGWPTASVRDGAHTVAVSLEDAAGNVSTVVGPLSVTTDNEPPRGGTVTVTRAGATLAAIPAGFSGQDVAYTYRWQRCSPECEDVATGARFTPAPGDTVRAVVTARDLGGETTVVSEPVSVAAAPSATATPSASSTPAAVPPAPLAGTPLPCPVGTVRAAAACARVTLSRRTIKTLYGRRVEIRGRVTDAGGAPLPGVTLDVVARVRTPGAKRRPAGSVGSARDGRFSYVAPAGPSRDLVIGGRIVTLLVTAAGSFDATRHGARVRFSGRIRGGHIPRAGVLVEIRGAKGVVALARTDGHGTYRATTKATRQSFRARTRKDSSWPFAGAPVGSPVSV